MMVFHPGEPKAMGESALTHISKKYRQPEYVVSIAVNRDKGTVTCEARWKESLATMWRTVVDTREQAIRAGLIKLGWTPPKEGV